MENPCPFCGEPIKDVAKKCRHCGEWLEGGPPPDEEVGGAYAEPQSDEAGLRLVVPTGNISPLAVIAGYLGLGSVICFIGPIALLVGILALREIKADPSKYGKGRAIFGIVMGSLGTILLIFWAIGMIVSP